MSEKRECVWRYRQLCRFIVFRIGHEWVVMSQSKLMESTAGITLWLYFRATHMTPVQIFVRYSVVTFANISYLLCQNIRWCIGSTSRLPSPPLSFHSRIDRTSEQEIHCHCYLWWSNIGWNQGHKLARLRSPIPTKRTRVKKKLTLLLNKKKQRVKIETDCLLCKYQAIAL